MKKVQPQDLWEAKSEVNYHHEIDIDSEEDEIYNIHRNASLPNTSKEGERALIERFISLKVHEMSLDITKAFYILGEIPEQDFQTLSEEALLFRVVSAILIMEQYQESNTKEEQIDKIREIRNIIGSRNPNLMSYLNQKNQNRQSEQLLPQNCQICMDNIDGQLEEMQCSHSFCQPCLNEYLTQKIINGEVDDIRCPQQGCLSIISEEQILKLVGQDMHSKLLKFKKIKQLQQDPNIMWCPRPGCEEVVKKQGKKLQCICGQQICKKCGRQRHKGETCQNQLDKDFLQVVKKLKIQRCHQCKSPIQKNDGCNHMTCKQCNYEFCWLCRGKYSSKHYVSYNIFGCPGQQFAHRDPYKYPNLYRFLIIILILVLGPPLAVLALILGFIVLVIGLPAIAYMTYVPSYEFAEYHCCRKTIYIIFFIIACPVLSPISLILVLLGIAAGIIIGIPYLIYLFIDWLRNR